VAAQDEGRVPLDQLPLADLKTWLEDNLALEGHAGIIGGVGGGGGVTINDFSETGVLRESGLVVPQAKYHTVSIVIANNDDVIFQRFIPPKDITVSGVKVAEYQLPTGTSKIDVGIYDTNGSTLLTSTGAVAHSAVNLSSWGSYSFTANQALTGGHEYVLAYLNKINTGTWKYLGATAILDWRSLYMAGSSTIAQFMAHSWAARFAGTGWTALGTNVAGVAAVAAHIDAPIAVLQVV
jgi:hypothetical protein